MGNPAVSIIADGRIADAAIGAWTHSFPFTDQ
jgi:hypothetical protein